MPQLAYPKVADLAPSGPDLTVYDEEHGITYLRLLDADAEGADWREVVRIVLNIDPEQEPDRARRVLIVTLRAPNGYQTSDTSNCFDEGGRQVAGEGGAQGAVSVSN